MECKFVKKRFKVIRKYIMGKDVLDIGSVQHTSKNEWKEEWLHRLIKKECKSIIGVDIEGEEIKKLNNKGYNIVCADFETANLKRKFDVIVAGNVIEHLFNQGLFLENVKRHLKKEGKFILSTINCFGMRHFLWAFFKGRVPVNKTHTCYYDIETLRYLLERKGLYIKKCYYFTDSRGIKYFLERMLIFRKIFAPLILLVCEVKQR